MPLSGGCEGRGKAINGHSSNFPEQSVLLASRSVLGSAGSFYSLIHV